LHESAGSFEDVVVEDDDDDVLVEEIVEDDDEEEEDELVEEEIVDPSESTLQIPPTIDEGVEDTSDSTGASKEHPIKEASDTPAAASLSVPKPTPEESEAKTDETPAAIEPEAKPPAEESEPETMSAIEADVKDFGGKAEEGEVSTVEEEEKGTTIPPSEPLKEEEEKKSPAKQAMAGLTTLLGIEHRTMVEEEGNKLEETSKPSPSAADEVTVPSAVKSLVEEDELEQKAEVVPAKEAQVASLGREEPSFVQKEKALEEAEAGAFVKDMIGGKDLPDQTAVPAIEAVMEDKQPSGEAPSKDGSIGMMTDLMGEAEELTSEETPGATEIVELSSSCTEKESVAVTSTPSVSPEMPSKNKLFGLFPWGNKGPEPPLDSGEIEKDKASLTKAVEDAHNMQEEEQKASVEDASKVAEVLQSAMKVSSREPTPVMSNVPAEVAADEETKAIMEVNAPAPPEVTASWNDDEPTDEHEERSPDEMPKPMIPVIVAGAAAAAVAQPEPVSSFHEPQRKSMVDPPGSSPKDGSFSFEEFPADERAEGSLNKEKEMESSGSQDYDDAVEANTSRDNTAPAPQHVTSGPDDIARELVQDALLSAGVQVLEPEHEQFHDAVPSAEETSDEESSTSGQEQAGDKRMYNSERSQDYPVAGDSWNGGDIEEGVSRDLLGSHQEKYAGMREGSSHQRKPKMLEIICIALIVIIVIVLVVALPLTLIKPRSEPELTSAPRGPPPTPIVRMEQHHCTFI